MKNRSMSRLLASALYPVVADRFDAADRMLEAVSRQMDADASLSRFLDNPKIEIEPKLSLLRGAFGTDGIPELEMFLRILIRRRALDAVPAILEHFRLLQCLRLKQIPVEMTTTQALPDAARADVETRLARALGREIRVGYRVRPDLIAGARVRIGDRTIDNTLRGKLNALKQCIRTKTI